MLGNDSSIVGAADHTPPLTDQTTKKSYHVIGRFKNGNANFASTLLDKPAVAPVRFGGNL